MPDRDDIPRLSRLAAILVLLQSKRVITASEIAEKFNISKRTVYRDIKALGQAGVPVYSEEGRGYLLMKGYTLPPVMFTEQEANALITAEKLISRNKDASLVEHHRDAIAKVKAVLGYSNKDKVELLLRRMAFIKNLSNDTTSNCMSTVQIAITNFKPLNIKYHSLSKDETTTRTIEPQALYHTQENWILIAWCRLRNDYREFRLDRIQTIEMEDQPFSGRNFNLMGYFNSLTKKNNSDP